MRKIYFAVLLLVIFFLFLPKILSTPLARPLFQKAIERKTRAQVAIGSLRLSWLGPQTFHQVIWSKGEVKGAFEQIEVQAPFWSFSGPFELKGGRAEYPGGQIDQIEGRGQGTHFQGSAGGGALSLEGEWKSENDYQVEFNLKQFPLGVIDPRLSEILGTTAEIRGHAALKGEEGEIQLHFASPQLVTEVEAALSKDGIRLKEPWRGTLHVTPALSAYLLQEVNPLFLKEVEAKSPIQLTINPQDFYCPIPFSWDRLVVSGKLDLGQVQCRNGKSLATLMGFLKMEEFKRVKEMQVWFTPFSFSLRQQMLELGRVDLLLANTVHLCTWGQVNLKREEVEMVLGVPADTLQRSFGLKHLPESYVLKVDVRGPMADPEIMTGPAVAKIAVLMAGNQIPKKGILKGIGEVFSHPKEEKGVPPAVRPFPWE